MILNMWTEDHEGPLKI